MKCRAVVRVPGSTSNLGSGFDCIGAAVDRWLTASVVVLTEPGAETVIQRGGTLAGLDVPASQDWITVGVRVACEAAGKPVPRALRIRASSQIPVARGLGSSAAAVVAGATAATGICGFSLTDEQLLDACAAVEGHPDNVAAAIYGGAVLVVPSAAKRVVPLTVAKGLALVFAVPDFETRTRDMRAVLPTELPHATATRAAGLSAALVHGLATGDGDTLRAALEDVLHVPYRRALVRGFDDVCGAAVAAGAFGATLSGSGSTLVAVAPAAQANAVAEAMCTAWRAQGVQADGFVNPSSSMEGRSMVVRHDCEDVPATAGAAG